jgi:Fe-S cluster biogenesis protein NfuA
MVDRSIYFAPVDGAAGQFPVIQADLSSNVVILLWEGSCQSCCKGKWARIKIHMPWNALI